MGEITGLRDILVLGTTGVPWGVRGAVKARRPRPNVGWSPIFCHGNHVIVGPREESGVTA